MSLRTVDRESDLSHLRRAVELSREKMLAGAGGPFGAVIAGPDGVVGEGWNCVTSMLDPTAHAEVVSIRAACERLARFELSGLTIYSSCEPCPMCLAAIYWARLDRLVYANTRAEAAAIGFDDAEFYTQIALPLDAQTLPTEHLGLEEARAVFELWRVKAEKISY
ncbi:MAG: nucleoside deaminase [Thermoanaerobaculia bacterium]